jgi:hypothetical protein
MKTSRFDEIDEDSKVMTQRLDLYINNGRITGAAEAREEPVVAIKPNQTLIKALKKIENFDGHFLAVDCSTRTLKRANNWGIYLMRASYASVKQRVVDWGFAEKICTAVGDANSRSNLLKDIRIELESQMALAILENKISSFYYDHNDSACMHLQVVVSAAGFFKNLSISSLTL